MSIDGNYNITAETPLGRMKIALVMRTDGDSLSGSASSAMMGSAEFNGGKVDGNSFSFEAELNSPLGKVKMTNSGFVEGNCIQGEVKTSMGVLKYTGERVQCG